jgi:hypothetical protein
MNDGRAISTCSLGPLISAEIAAADSLQENGLVKYKGYVELSGIFRPALGTIVTFTYTMGGTAYTVPKKMRVLSAFANPLTPTTSVELGCLLSYKADLREPEKIDTELANKDYSLVAGDTPWDRYPALVASHSASWGATAGGGSIASGFWDSDYKRVGASVNAQWAVKYCLEKLGITASSIPLTNTFRLQEFDFSAGWVQVISDLLQSESCIGELDYDEVLQIRSLTDETAPGPMIYRADMHSVAPINAGGIPPNALGVEYSVWRFNSTPNPAQAAVVMSGKASADNPEWSGGVGFVVEDDEDDNDIEQPPQPPPLPPEDDDRKRNPEDAPGWEVSEQIGPQTFAIVKYETKANKSKTAVFPYFPSSITKTNFTYVNGQRVPLSRKEVRTSILAAEASDYVAAKLKEGSADRAEEIVEFSVVTDFEYYPNGERKAETRSSFAPKITVVGGSNLEFWWPQGVVEVSGALMEEQRVMTEYYPAGEGEAQVVTKWDSWLKTIPGQQASASASKKIKNLEEAEYYAHRIVNSGLYLMGQTTEITRRNEPSKKTEEEKTDNPEYVELAPARFRMRMPGRTDMANARLGANEYDDRARPSDGDSFRRDEKVQIDWVYGDGDEPRRSTISMPYNSDDEVIPQGGMLGGWVIVKSTAQEKALRYGRVQNRLTYGYRNGMEIQMTPWKMPGYAFAPLHISIDGLVAQYRVNNPSWVLTAGEAVASCNAIYWGVVGTT